jgi:hypothetical protein
MVGKVIGSAPSSQALGELPGLFKGPCQESFSEEGFVSNQLTYCLILPHPTTGPPGLYATFSPGHNVIEPADSSSVS